MTTLLLLLLYSYTILMNRLLKLNIVIISSLLSFRAFFHRFVKKNNCLAAIVSTTALS